MRFLGFRRATASPLVGPPESAAVGSEAGLPPRGRVQHRMERPAAAEAHDEKAATEAHKETPDRRFGHVFVLHCNVQGLAADAILVGLIAGSRSRVPVGSVRALTEAEMLQIGRGQNRRTQVYEGQITTAYYHTEAEAVAGAMQVIRAYLAMAGAALKGRGSSFGRPKPLVALPMPGVGLMDMTNLVKEVGHIIHPLLCLLYRAAKEHEVDIALCTVDADAFKVAQVLRAGCCRWPSLTSSHLLSLLPSPSLTFSRLLSGTPRRLLPVAGRAVLGAVAGAAGARGRAAGQGGARPARPHLWRGRLAAVGSAAEPPHPVPAAPSAFRAHSAQ